MRFAKYQGIGNDFIVVEREATVRLGPELVKRLCDRHYGIGADGVLVVEPGEAAPWRMTVHNADGSVPEMCGNGLRCVVRYLRDRRPTLPETFVVETGAGPLPVSDGPDGVTVQMGAIVDHGPRTVMVESRRFEGRFVSLGNPHFVLFGRFDDAEFARLGPALVGHAAFEAGANISFAEPHADGIQLRVWERGAGPTLACGTGACATAAAAWLEKRAAPGAVRIDLPGGRLSISGQPAAIRMTGGAKRVFEGVWTG